MILLLILVLSSAFFTYLISVCEVCTKFLSLRAGWLPLCVKSNWLSTWYKVDWWYLRNRIVSLATMVLKITVLVFDTINIKELEYRMDRMDGIFKPTTFPSLMSLPFQAILPYMVSKAIINSFPKSLLKKQHTYIFQANSLFARLKPWNVLQVNMK